jgi:hypothetical protein
MNRVYLEMNEKENELKCKIRLNTICYANFLASYSNSVYGMFKIGICSYQWNLGCICIVTCMSGYKRGLDW